MPYDAPPSPSEQPIRPPHPLASRLVACLPRGARVLDVGSGSGRNAAALQGAGLRVVSLPDVDIERIPNGPFDGAVATHALLHGTPDSIAARLAGIARALAPNAPFFATFGSRSDARFGAGMPIDEATFAPLQGDEIGVPHAFFHEATLRRLIEVSFSIASLEERDVDTIAGPWAHARAPLRGAVHWFVEARRRRPDPP